jgi:hypothetical protein
MTPFIAYIIGLNSRVTVVIASKFQCAWFDRNIIVLGLELVSITYADWISYDLKVSRYSVAYYTAAST